MQPVHLPKSTQSKLLEVLSRGVAEVLTSTSTLATLIQHTQSFFDKLKIFKKSGKQFDFIVAIARGGLTLSQLSSDSLTLSIACFTVESYKTLKQQKLPS